MAADEPFAITTPHDCPDEIEESRVHPTHAVRGTQSLCKTLLLCSTHSGAVIQAPPSCPS